MAGIGEGWRKAGERRTQRGDAAALLGAGQMDFGMRGGVRGELGRDPFGGVGERRRAKLVGLGQHDLIGDAGLVEHLQDRAVELLDAVAGSRSTGTPGATPRASADSAAPAPVQRLTATFDASA